MTQDRPRSSRLRPATPERPNRPLRAMPRQVRQAPTPKRERGARTVLGRPWPLAISPVALGLLVALVAVAGAAWFLEGRYETPPAEAAKQVIPYKADAIQAVDIATTDGKTSFRRDAAGKMTTDGPPPAPTPTPEPGAPPPPVTFSPSTRVESILGQLASLRVDRVIASEASSSATYGLDTPQMTLTLTPKDGAPLTLAVGRLNPDETAYYVRREQRKDTILVSRYSLDDLIKVAGEVIKGTG